MKLTKKAAAILEQEAAIILAQTEKLTKAGAGHWDKMEAIDYLRNVAFRLQRYTTRREIKYSEL